MLVREHHDLIVEYLHTSVGLTQAPEASMSTRIAHPLVATEKTDPTVAAPGTGPHVSLDARVKGMHYITWIHTLTLVDAALTKTAAEPFAAAVCSFSNCVDILDPLKLH